MGREGRVERRTAETEVSLRLLVDGKGEARISTGIPFMDHMLTLFSKHGFFDIDLEAKGDLAVDFHHTVDDIGISLGRAFKEALGDFNKIRRYGSATIPMDEVLVTVAIDLSNRPYLIYNVPKVQERVGGFDWELLPGFFKGFADHLGCTLHINLHYGTNAHHIAEAIFKAFSKALDSATTIEPRLEGVLSTKGVL